MNWLQILTQLAPYIETLTPALLNLVAELAKILASSSAPVEQQTSMVAALGAHIQAAGGK